MCQKRLYETIISQSLLLARSLYSLAELGVKQEAFRVAKLRTAHGTENVRLVGGPRALTALPLPAPRLCEGWRRRLLAPVGGHAVITTHPLRVRRR
jgi:hypothetical protein